MFFKNFCLAIFFIYVLLILLVFLTPIFGQNDNFHVVIIGADSSNVMDYGNYLPKSNQASNLSIESYNNTLTIQADFKMTYIWIYNDLGFDLFSQLDTNFAIISLPSGHYHIFTGYAPETNYHTFIIKENIDVTGNCELNLSYKDAIYDNVYTFNKINADTLNISTITFYFFNQFKNVLTLSIKHINIDSNYFLLKHNTLPNHFDGEWAVKGKPFYNNNDLYLLNNQLFFFESDTLITNDINNFVFADIDYFLPDSILPSTHKQIFTFIPDYHASGNGDLLYTFPLTQRLYQDTVADISLRSSKFGQSVFINQMSLPHTYISTSEIRFNNGKILGYHFREPEPPPFILSDTNYVKFGQTPTFWFGRFFNTIDTIKIRSSYGRWDYLFLSQTNDLLRHYPIEYKIFQNSIIINSGLFDLLFRPGVLRLGFNPEDLTISIDPGKYIVNVKNKFNEVAGSQGYSEVNASFDLNQTDKNPPNIVSFQILSGKEITHKFYNNINKKVRFMVEDDVLIDSISLFYSKVNDSLKYNLSLSYNEPYWECNLPPFPPGYFNLHTFVQDNSQNYIECNMSPAFCVDSSVLSIQQPNTIQKEFYLLQNYPNPFNSTTNIPFSLPANFNKNVKITIYNILGQQIIILLDKVINTSINNIKWDGYNKNRNAVPSGIYFIKMKGGKYEMIKKILFIK